MSEAGTQDVTAVEGQAGEFNWFESIPETYQEDQSLLQFKDQPFEKFIESHVNLRKGFGSRIPLPKDENDAEAWNEVYTKLGRPGKPEEYELPEPELPEGVEYQVDEKFKADITQKAFELGVSKKALSELASVLNQHQIANISNQQQEQLQTPEKAMQQLQEVWGEQAEQNLQTANAVFQRFAPDGLKEDFEKEFGNSPVALRIFHAFSRVLGEDSMSDTGTKSVRTLDQVNTEIAQLMDDPNMPPFEGQENFDVAKHREVNDKLKVLYTEKDRIEAQNHRKQLEQNLQIM